MSCYTNTCCVKTLLCMYYLRLKLFLTVSLCKRKCDIDGEQPIRRLVRPWLLPGGGGGDSNIKMPGCVCFGSEKRPILNDTLSCNTYLY